MVPGPVLAISHGSAPAAFTSWSPKRSRMSPGAMPARAAGPSATTPVTRAPCARGNPAAFAAFGLTART